MSLLQLIAAPGGRGLAEARGQRGGPGSPGSRGLRRSPFFAARRSAKLAERLSTVADPAGIRAESPLLRARIEGEGPLTASFS